MLDKLTYAGRRENLAGPRRRARRTAAIEDADDGRARRWRRRRRGRELRRRDARRPLDRRARRVRAHARARHLRAARGGPRARACATCRSRPTRSTARSRRARSPSPRRCSRPRPTARRRPAPTCSSPRYVHTYGLETLICRGSNNYGPYQYPEKLIPLMVLNALHGDPLPVYGDGMQVRNWLYVEDFAPRHRPRARARRARRGLQRRRPRRVHRTSRSSSGSSSSPGADESLIEYVTDRPGHDRRYSLGSREGPRAGLGGAGALRRGPGADGRLVPRQRVVVGADPLAATTARTTSASTGARWAEARQPGRPAGRPADRRRVGG